MQDYLTPSNVARFWAKVNKDGPIIRPELGPCWVWTGPCANGYGTLSVITSNAPSGHSNVRAHRFSRELSHGPIPPGMMVCHHCDNRACVRPDHLFVGVARDNVHDMIRKGRHMHTVKPETVARGEQVGTHKLTAEQVTEIRRIHASGLASYRRLAAMFGIDRTAVYKIVTRRRWCHI